MDKFNLWYFLLYLIPESLVFYIIILKRLGLSSTIKRLLLASVITASCIAIFRYYFLGFHSFATLILYFLFINFYFKMNNYVKSLLSIILASIIIMSLGEVFMIVYGMIIPNFSMNYMINAPILTRLLIAYPILITFYIVYRFMPILFTNRGDTK
jgi:hypothetical protein